MVYLSFTSSTTRPISRFARSGAVLTVTSLIDVSAMVGVCAVDARVDGVLQAASVDGGIVQRMTVHTTCVRLLGTHDVGLGMVIQDPREAFLASSRGINDSGRAIAGGVQGGQEQH